VLLFAGREYSLGSLSLGYFDQQLTLTDSNTKQVYKNNKNRTNKRNNLARFSQSQVLWDAVNHPPVVPKWKPTKDVMDEKVFARRDRQVLLID
jgi:hypothetical protein